ncbi:putative quinol monooxygenase [Alkalihalobacillus sp. FSL W8-0930]
MIITHVRFQIKPEKEEGFLALMHNLVAETRKEEGNISYELMKSTEEEHTYSMIETWKDEEATKIHNASEHFTAFLKEIPEFLAGPAEAKAFAGEQLEL